MHSCSLCKLNTAHFTHGCTHDHTAMPIQDAAQTRYSCSLHLASSPPPAKSRTAFSLCTICAPRTRRPSHHCRTLLPARAWPQATSAALGVSQCRSMEHPCALPLWQRHHCDSRFWKYCSAKYPVATISSSQKRPSSTLSS